MSNLNDYVKGINEELEKITKEHEYIASIKAENEAEQARIIEQNRTLAHTIDEVTKEREDVTKQRNDLNEREKQIILKEKSIIISNRLLDEKLLDFRKRTVELSQQEKKLKADLEEYYANKQVVDQQALINKKMEETELLNKQKIKLKEDKLDKEIQRLESLQV